MKKYLYILVATIIGIFANYADNKIILLIACASIGFCLFKIFKEFGVFDNE